MIRNKYLVRLLPLIGLFLFYGCGYKMAVGKTDRIYQVKDLINLSNDLSVTENINSYINEYLTTGESDNTVTFTIVNCDVTADLTSASREAEKSVVYLTLYIEVINSSGAVMYEKYLSSNKTFTTGRNITEYKRNKLHAISEAVEAILSRFRFEYER